MPEIEFSEIIVSIVSLIMVSGGFWYFDRRSCQRKIEKTKKEMSDRLYELAILKELGERIGYSLNVENIIDVITGSLNQFIDYSVVSYILLQPEKLIFKARLEKSVSRDFLDDIKGRMTKSLSALTDHDLAKVPIEEVLSGALVLEESDLSANAYFNIPLVIADKLVGILTIADSRKIPYKEEEMTILYKLTAQASKAVSRLQEIVSTEQGKLSSMVQSMNEGLIMTDIDYRILTVNPSAKSILNLKDDPSIFDLIKKLDGKLNIRDRLEESLKLNKVFEFDNVEIETDKFYKILISPVKNKRALDQDKILGSVIIFRDVTIERELEVLKNDFTSMMVHELRTPVDGIKKIADLIIRRADQIDKEKIISDYAPLIRSSAGEMLRLVNNLLDASKIEAGKYEVIKASNDLRDLVKEKFNFYHPTAESENISLAYFVDKNIPDKFEFDRSAIGEVLTNLLSNSFKFTAEGGKVNLATALYDGVVDIKEQFIQAGIDIFDHLNEFKLDQKFIWVAVSDNGSGISSDKIPLMFNKFKQFRSSTETRKGTGLGLFISKGIIKEHGGEIFVFSEEGKGSTFMFTLPID